MKRIPILLTLALLACTVVRADEGPDVIEPLSNGEAEAMQEIYLSVKPAAKEGNRVAQAIVFEARTALGHDWVADRFMVKSKRGNDLNAETEDAWIDAVLMKANGGDPFFMSVFGYMNWWGYAVPRDRKVAVEWWKKGAEAKGGMAMWRLANCYLNGTLPLDFEKAMQYYGEAGEIGIPVALFSIGAIYNESMSGVDADAVQRDVNKAMKYWIEAGLLGHAKSQLAVGSAYMSGDEGLEVNKELGAKWLRMAAENGNSRARDYVRRFLDNKPEQRDLPEAIPTNGTEVASSFIAFDNIEKHIADPKVSVVCLLDSYRPRPFTGRSGRGGSPSSMLDYYLSALRTLESEGDDASVNPADVKIFIIEGHGDTRALIRKVDKQFGSKGFDGTIPAIYIFTSGKSEPVKTYTYETGAGSYGASVKQQVVELLTEPKDGPEPQ